MCVLPLLWVNLNATKSYVVPEIVDFVSYERTRKQRASSETDQRAKFGQRDKNGSLKEQHPNNDRKKGNSVPSRNPVPSKKIQNYHPDQVTSETGPYTIRKSCLRGYFSSHRIKWQRLLKRTRSKPANRLPQRKWSVSYYLKAFSNLLQVPLVLFVPDRDTFDSMEFWSETDANWVLRLIVGQSSNQP